MLSDLLINQVSLAKRYFANILLMPKLDQGWISDMEIDGPTFVPKSCYFLLILVNVTLKKLAFPTFRANFTSRPFRQNVDSFKQENSTPLSLFLALLHVYFQNLALMLFERLSFHYKSP